MYKKTPLENRIFILYLIEKMEIPISTNVLESCALKYMDYFVLTETIHNLIEHNFIELSSSKDETIRYIITDSGIQTLDFFEKELSQEVRNEINQYVIDNRKSIKRDFQTTANYFYDDDDVDKKNNITVKCGLYEDEELLLEVQISVVSLNQAKFICDNWRKNTSRLYNNILKNLIDENPITYVSSSSEETGKTKS